MGAGKLIKNSTLLIVAFIFIVTNVNAITLRIRVESNKNPDELIVGTSIGKLLIKADSLSFELVSPMNLVKLKKHNDSIRVYLGDELKGVFKNLSFSSNESDIKLQLLPGTTIARNYPGKLLIYLFEGSFRVINELNIDDYIPGVILSEVGKGSASEFYKVKSIICRTYALSNLRKHEAEGFNLCNLVHCQVYNGSTNYAPIKNAVNQTSGMVLVDDDLKFINASFYSNCGGQTCNSEDVWLKALPYLRSVKDTFCTHQLSGNWEKKIVRSDWMNYFSTKYKLDTNDVLIRENILSFKQDSRLVNFIEYPVKIPLKVLRDDWKLRSTFFTVYEASGYMLLKGKGFGHGVGLCQEGAMQMAKNGSSVRQIISYYYSGVTLLNISEMDFFKDE